MSWRSDTQDWCRIATACHRENKRPIHEEFFYEQRTQRALHTVIFQMWRMSPRKAESSLRTMQVKDDTGVAEEIAEGMAVNGMVGVDGQAAQCRVAREG